MGATIAICVPARNEELLLPVLLDALGALERGAEDVAICVHLDACTDQSAAVLARVAATLPVPVNVDARQGGEPNAVRQN